MIVGLLDAKAARAESVMESILGAAAMRASSVRASVLELFGDVSDFDDDGCLPVVAAVLHDESHALAARSIALTHWRFGRELS